MIYDMSHPLDRYCYYRDNAWAFLMDCCYTLNQVNEEHPIATLPNRKYAKLYVEAWQKYKLLAIPKTRRMTMSWFTVALYVHDTIFKQARHNAFVSKKEDDADELVKRAEFILKHIPADKIDPKYLPKWEKTFCKITFPEINSIIEGFPQGADQLRQFTFSGIFGDESAFWEASKEFYAASKPTIDGGGRMTLVSSPAPGFFKKICFDAIDQPGEINVEEYMPKTVNPMEGVRIWHNMKNKFVIFELHYTADPDKRSPAFKEAIRSSMPVMEYLREYELHWDTFAGFPVYPEYSKLHEIREAPYAVAGLPMLIGFDFGLCYDDQTEVLTEAGWKLMKDVSCDENIGTLNPNTFELYFQKPKLKLDNPYKGKMIHYEGNSCNFAITPDHIMPVWYDKKEMRRYYAKDIKKSPRHKYIRLTANWTGSDIPNNLELSPLDYAGFMGAYLSEGTSDGQKVRLTQIKDKTWMADIIQNTPWDWKDIKTGFVTNNTALAKKLHQLGIQEKRCIPQEIKTGSKEVMLEFIRAYTLGDGHIRIRPNGATEHTLFTCSEQMAKDFQELALKVGWDSSCCYVKPTESFLASENRFIKSSGGYSITFKKRTAWAELVKENFTEVDYDGRIYCFSVKDHILCTRRNGYVHFNGNTPAAVIAQYQEETLYIFKEYVEVNMGAVRFVEKVLADMRFRWPNFSDLRKNWICYIDPSGVNRTDTDENSCALVLSGVGFVPNPGPIAFEDRRKAVQHFLMGMCKEGPRFQIYVPECPVLAKGFEGGYRFSDKAAEIEPNKLRPIKDAYSHPHDALQYVCHGVNGMISKIKRTIPKPGYSITEQTRTVRHG